ncbi:MAG: hypothetical protein JST54_24110 [Deltaproteobacteria bacterium]|nr:hypothetical protein [Deltaproteobacteria bacterium]
MAKSSAASAASKLPSGKLPQTNLIESGAKHATQLLIEFAQGVLPKTEQSGFERFGITAAWRQSMEALIAEIEADGATRTDLDDGNLSTGSDLDDVVTRAKDWRRTALTVVSVMPSAKGKRITVPSGSSPKALSDGITRLLRVVGDKAAAEFGGGSAFATQGKALAKELATSQKAHKQAAGKLSPVLRHTNLLKGVLYMELKRAAKVARNVVPSEAHLFAVSMHARAGKRRKKSGADAGSGASSTPLPDEPKS